VALLALATTHMEALGAYGGSDDIGEEDTPLPPRAATAAAALAASPSVTTAAMGEHRRLSITCCTLEYLLRRFGLLSCTCCLMAAAAAVAAGRRSTYELYRQRQAGSASATAAEAAAALAAATRPVPQTRVEARSCGNSRRCTSGYEGIDRVCEQRRVPPILTTRPPQAQGLLEVRAWSEAGPLGVVFADDLTVVTVDAGSLVRRAPPGATRRGMCATCSPVVMIKSSRVCRSSRRPPPSRFCACIAQRSPGCHAEREW
jgi:hypothetical protein